MKHPRCVFDGVLPLKVRDEVELAKWVYAIVIPEAHQETAERHVPNGLMEKVIYVKNDCRDIWEWSEKVYSIIENREYQSNSGSGTG